MATAAGVPAAQSFGPGAFRLAAASTRSGMPARALLPAGAQFRCALHPHDDPSLDASAAIRRILAGSSGGNVAAVELSFAHHAGRKRRGRFSTHAIPGRSGLEILLESALILFH